MPQQQTSDAGAFKFTASLENLKVARAGDSGAGGEWTMRGHAAVFNRPSHDMGGFRIKIAPGAFTSVLDGNPDVHLNREHDMRMVLARTRNGSLDLREDPMGLHAYARFAKIPLAEETATLMSGGYIDQMSFACDYRTDSTTWVTDAAENTTMTIHEFSGLYDVCVCAQGAFPQTDASLMASLRDASDVFKRAQEEGRIVGIPRGDSTIAVPDAPVLVDLAAFKAAAQQRFDAAQAPEAA